MRQVIIIEGGVVREVICDDPNLELLVVDRDIDGSPLEDIVRILTEDCIVYEGLKPKHCAIDVNQAFAELEKFRGTKYFVFGEHISRSYHYMDFNSLLNEIEESGSADYALHKFAPGTDVSEILEAADGWRGNAEITAEEYYELLELEYKLNNGTDKSE